MNDLTTGFCLGYASACALLVLANAPTWLKRQRRRAERRAALRPIRSNPEDLQ